VTALSYTHGTGATALLGDTIGDNLARTAATWPQREALVDVPSGRRWTYARLMADVDELAYALLASGVVKGDRVGIWAVNCPEWVLVQYATARIGAIMVNINPAYRVHEVEYVLKQAGICLLFASLGHKGSDYRAMVEEVRGRCPGLREAVYFGDPSWQALLGRAVPRALPDDLSCDDAVNIQYTSGTTGFPKGATLSHHNILNNGYFVGESIAYTEQDRVCLPVPFYHCFGMVMGNLAATSHGACIVIPAPSFDPKATLEAVQQESCTSLYGVPTMFIAELNLPDFARYDLSSLRTGIMAGSPCPVEVMKRVVAEMHMEQVSICYGIDRDLPRLAPDPDGRRPGAPHRNRRPRPAARRGEDRRPRHRGHSTPGNSRGVVHPRLRRDARLLERTRQDRGGRRPRPLDAHRRSGRDARGRLCRDRRPHQGHDHPRRREHLPARDRGVPLRPPEDRRRPGDRRPARAVRRGGAGLRHPAQNARTSSSVGGSAGVRVLDSFPMTVSGKVRKIELRERYSG
jgi:acyl-CoA synthetase (AMP-forming)/AMP-acid ligase II